VRKGDAQLVPSTVSVCLCVCGSRQAFGQAVSSNVLFSIGGPKVSARSRSVYQWLPRGCAPRIRQQVCLSNGGPRGSAALTGWRAGASPTDVCLSDRTICLPRQLDVCTAAQVCLVAQAVDVCLTAQYVLSHKLWAAAQEHGSDLPAQFFMSVQRHILSVTQMDIRSTAETVDVCLPAQSV
jgi:hypothetical protein